MASGIAGCGDLIWKDLDSLALVGLERGGETGSVMVRDVSFGALLG